MIAGSHANYGFGYDAARDGYEIDEEAMRVVRRIFRMVGPEGATLHAVKRTFEREGLPTPKGGTFWSQPFLRSVVLVDVYKPHAFEEVAALVSAAVAARLNPGACGTASGGTTSTGRRSWGASRRPTATRGDAPARKNRAKSG